MHEEIRELQFYFRHLFVKDSNSVITYLQYIQQFAEGWIRVTAYKLSSNYQIVNIHDSNGFIFLFFLVTLRCFEKLLANMCPYRCPAKSSASLLQTQIPFRPLDVFLRVLAHLDRDGNLLVSTSCQVDLYLL